MRALIIIMLVLIAPLAAPVFCQSSITYGMGTEIIIGTGADVCADAIIINGTFSGSGTICQGPLPVTLLSLTASVKKREIILNWTTENEINNSGFEIERSPAPQNSTGKQRNEGYSWVKLGFVPGSGTTNEQNNYTFEDKKLNSGKYSYRIKQVDYSGSYEYYNLNGDVIIKPPGDFSISQNYPNPSNPRCKIDYQLPEKSNVNIKLYDMLGREVITLVNETKDAGYYTAEFDGSNFASGVYFYKLVAGSFNKIIKMVLVK